MNHWMHQARWDIIMINKLESRKLLSRNKQSHLSQTLFRIVPIIRYFRQHSSNSYLSLVKYTYSLYNKIPSNQHKQFLNSHKKEREEPGDHCLSLPAEWWDHTNVASLPLKNGQESWEGTSSYSLSPSPLSKPKSFCWGERQEGEEWVVFLFLHSPLLTCHLICEQEPASHGVSLLHSLISISVLDLFMTASYPLVHVPVLSFRFSLPVFYTLPCHQKFVFRRRKLIPLLPLFWSVI